MGDSFDDHGSKFIFSKRFFPKLPVEVGNTVGKANLSVTKKGLRTNLKPLFIKLVSGAGFEPATFGL